MVGFFFKKLEFDPDADKISLLYDDALHLITNYLDLDDLKSFGQTCKRFFHITSQRIASNNKITVCYHRVGEIPSKLMRSYKGCQIIICGNTERPRNSWNNLLKHSFKETKSVHIKYGSIKWQDLRMDLGKFENLTSLSLNNVELTPHRISHPCPDLSKLEKLNICFTKNLSSCFFLNCKNLKTFRTCANSSVFDINEILKQQTCLEDLTVASYESNFLLDDFSSNFQFDLKRFVYFGGTMAESNLVKDNLIKFLERHRNLKSLALNFVTEIFLDCDFEQRHFDCFMKRIDKCSRLFEQQEKLVGARSDGINQLDFLFFRKFDARPLIEYVSLFNKIYKIFPIVRTLSVNNVFESTESMDMFLNHWITSMKSLNYMEYNIKNMLSSRILSECCTTIRICCDFEYFDVEDWRLFLANNSHIQNISLQVKSYDEIFNDDYMLETLKALRLLRNLETLEIDISNGLEDHLIWIAKNLKLKVLKLYPFVFKELTEETKEQFGNTKISQFEFKSIFSHFYNPL